VTELVKQPASRHHSHHPDDLRRLKVDQVRQVADRIAARDHRRRVVTAGISAPASASSELTTALHYIFDTPRDRLIWDVGHQAYPHKILTGQRDRIRTLAPGGGLSGFNQANREPITIVRAPPISSTSISAALRPWPWRATFRRQETTSSR